MISNNDKGLYATGEICTWLEVGIKYSNMRVGLYEYESEYNHTHSPLLPLVHWYIVIE